MDIKITTEQAQAIINVFDTVKDTLGDFGKCILEYLINEVAENNKIAISDKADTWWYKLPKDIKIKYTKEVFDKRGTNLKYSNNGCIIGLVSDDIVELFNKYSQLTPNETNP